MPLTRRTLAGLSPKGVETVSAAADFHQIQWLARLIRRSMAGFASSFG